MSDSRPATPPGWYADPQDQQALRYWDGVGWTDRVSPVSPQSVVPPPRDHVHGAECFACGRMTPDPDTCGACGFPVRRPAQRPLGRVGAVLDVKRWPRRTRALVIGDDGETLIALVRSGAIEVPAKSATPVGQFDARADLLTATGVMLDLAGRPDELQRLQLPFPAERLRQACLSADIPPAEAVGVALDALWLGEEAVLVRSGLPPGSVAAMAIERALGQRLPPPGARYGELPAGRFGRLVEPTVRWLVSEHPDTASPELMAWLRGFGADPLARVAAAAFDAAAIDPAVAPALRSLPGADDRTLSAYEQLTRDRLPLVASRQAPWLAVAAALAGVPFDPRDLVAARPGVDLLDDLVERGQLTADLLPLLEPSTDTTYLTARLAPERLDVRQLQELRFVAELDRRARLDATGSAAPPQPLPRHTSPSGVTVRDAGQRAARQLLLRALRVAVSQPDADAPGPGQQLAPHAT